MLVNKASIVESNFMAKTLEGIKADAIRRARLWYRNNRVRAAATRKVWAQKNREKVNAQVRVRYLENKEVITVKKRAWVAENKVKNTAYKTKYRDNNRDRVRKSAREYVARRKETDANFKIRYALRSRINSALKSSGVRKSDTTMALIGCDAQFLRGFLEARFQPGMNWKNHGEWHVDHKIPCAEFDLRDPAQQRQCFHYSNLQPLWGPDNLKKNGNRPPTHQAELI